MPIQCCLAVADYDRTRALHDRTVQASGLDLTVLKLPVEDIFFRMTRFKEFDVSEMSLSNYLVTLDANARGPFVALPVFPSRAFRHSGIYVHAGAGITRPSDLRGRRVGIPEYAMTAAVWIRGILAEHHDLPINAVKYFTGGLHEPGRTEKSELRLPRDVDVRPIPGGACLADMLASGELDAVYSARTPKCYGPGKTEVRRLFADPAEVEAQYFRSTGIFPIMHVVVMRRDFYESHRWAAKSLVDAFEAARSQALHGIDDNVALKYMLPWLVDEVGRTRAVMGASWWTYGLDEGNVHALQTLARYSSEQGLGRRPFRAEEIFAPETLESALV